MTALVGSSILESVGIVSNGSEEGGEKKELSEACTGSWRTGLAATFEYGGVAVVVVVVAAVID